MRAELRRRSATVRPAGVSVTAPRRRDAVVPFAGPIDRTGRPTAPAAHTDRDRVAARCRRPATVRRRLASSFGDRPTCTLPRPEKKNVLRSERVRQDAARQ